MTSQPPPENTLAESKPLDTLEAGYRLKERYRIEAFLEVKDQANLYRAIDEVTNLTVIIKEKIRLTTSRLSEEILKNPWFDEFSILRSISYPTVVKAVDMFEENSKYYLIIEQLEGRDLGYFMTQEKVSVHQSCDWMIQLCQSLSQLHRRQIVHLDLHPRDIVVARDLQRVRLTGFSRAQQLPILLPIETVTPGYSPPELHNHGERDINERADIYSLGVIWHQLLTGFNPIKHAKHSDALEFPEVTYYVPDINPEINRIVMKMIAPEPSQRFHSIDDVKRAILSLFHNAPFYASFITDVGQVREANEDSYFVQDWNYVSQTQRNSYGIFIVADGMGGAEAGEYASALATREVSAVINERLEQAKLAPQADLNIPEILEEAIKKANKTIYDEAKRYPNKYAGMGTTVTASVVYQGLAYIGHVGDSRAYLITRDRIEKITRDHSLVGRLLEIGQITEEEADVHPQRNLIYRSLGAYPNVEVDMLEIAFPPSYRLLLCSDGLVEHIKDREIHDMVLKSRDNWSACNQLVNVANIRGGDDNITIIIVYMDDIR